jgi:hypothetical protein
MKKYFNEQFKLRPPPHSMAPTYWSKKIESCIELIWEDMFNGDICDIDDDLLDFKIPLDLMPKGMNMDSKFYDLPY